MRVASAPASSSCIGAMSTSMDIVASAGSSSSPKLPRIAWLPITNTRSAARISVAARIACSSSARRIASRPFDRGQPLLLREHARKRADLTQIGIVLVLAEERIDELGSGFREKPLPLVQPTLRLRAPDRHAHALDVALGDLTPRSEIAKELDEKHAMQLELDANFGSIAGGGRENPPRKFRDRHTLVGSASGKRSTKVIRQPDSELRRVADPAQRLPSPGSSRRFIDRGHKKNVPRKYKPAPTLLSQRLRPSKSGPKV